MTWTNQEIADLRVLGEASVPAVRAAEIIGKTTGAVYDKARSEGITLARLLRSKKPKIIRPKRPPLLGFPYIVSPKPSNSDLLRANAMVPHAWPEWKRADICQSLMLALYEGQITLDELEANRANLGWFKKQYARAQDPYQEFSLGADNGDDERPYYDRAGGFTEATQEDAVYAREMATGKPMGLSSMAGRRALNSNTAVRFR